MKDLAEELNALGTPLDKRIRIIFGCTEEKGQWTDMDYYLATEERPDAGFTPDADFPLIYGEKGIAEAVISFRENPDGISFIKGGNAVNMVPAACSATIAHYGEITGKGLSAHGSTPEKGHNAIYDLMRQIEALERDGACHSDFAQFYLKHFADTTDGSLAGCYMEDDASGPITVNPGLIYMEGDLIKLHLDIRYPVTCTGEAVLQRLQQNLCPAAEVRLTDDEQPLYIPKDSPLVETLMAAYEKITGEKEEPTVIGGGTYAKAMENIVAFGPVFPGRECTEHQANEYVEIADLYQARRIYKEALKNL
jgi:succinyl-diaminopimelate desuccinylase